jgi:dienelactone hydrolase
MVAALSAVAVGSASGSKVPPYAQLVHLYDYDTGAPLALREESVETEDGVTVHDLSYADPRGGRVPAYLVLPSGVRHAPAVVWVPGLGESREDALDEALQYAKAGVAGIAITGTPPLFSCTRRDIRPYTRYVVQLRRAVDVLLSRPEVDATRIGYAGFSYGANIGGTLAGVEHRIRAYAFRSGSAYHSRFLRAQCVGRFSRKRMRAYTRAVSVVDPIRYVGHAAPAALLFQHGVRDTFASTAQLRKLVAVASEPKELRLYRAEHALNGRADDDLRGWLRAQLSF